MGDVAHVEREFDTTVSEVLLLLQSIHHAHPQVVSDIKARLQGLYTCNQQVIAQHSEQQASLHRVKSLLHRCTTELATHRADHTRATEQLETSIAAINTCLQRSSANELLKDDIISLRDAVAAVQTSLSDSQQWQARIDRLGSENDTLHDVIARQSLVERELKTRIASLSQELTGRIQQIQLITKGMGHDSNPVMLRINMEIEQNWLKAEAHHRKLPTYDNRIRSTNSDASNHDNEHEPRPQARAARRVDDATATPTSRLGDTPTPKATDASAGLPAHGTTAKYHIDRRSRFHRFVTLQRNENGSFGFVFQGGRVGDDFDPVVVIRVVPGGPAHKTGLLGVGDIILGLNDVSFDNRPHHEIVSHLKSCGASGTFEILSPYPEVSNLDVAVTSPRSSTDMSNATPTASQQSASHVASVESSASQGLVSPHAATTPQQQQAETQPQQQADTPPQQRVQPTDTQTQQLQPTDAPQTQSADAAGTLADSNAHLAETSTTTHTGFLTEEAESIASPPTQAQAETQAETHTRAHTDDDNSPSALSSFGFASMRSSLAAHDEIEDEPEIEVRAREFKLQGDQLMKAQQWSDAAELYSKAITVSPRNPALYLARASSRLHTGSFEKAFADCELAVYLNPKSAKAFNRMGFALQALGHLQAAADAHAMACDLEPEVPTYQIAFVEAQAALEAYSEQPTIMRSVQSNVVASGPALNAIMVTGHLPPQAAQPASEEDGVEEVYAEDAIAVWEQTAPTMPESVQAQSSDIHLAVPSTPNERNAPAPSSETPSAVWASRAIQFTVPQAEEVVTTGATPLFSSQ